MRYRIAVLTLLVSIATAHADRGTRVALIDRERLFSLTGIADFAAARKRLDTEKTSPKAESPDGKTVTPPTSGESEGSRLIREMQDKRQWYEYEEKTLEPIRTAVWRALEPYAKAQRIDLVIETSRVKHTLWYVGPGVDITDAFIKHYNASTAKRK